MKITVRSEGRAGVRSGKPYAIRKLRSSFDRISRNIRSIDLLLLDANGPRGGIDKVSRIAVDLGRRKILRLEGIGRTVPESVNTTVDRAKRLVFRSLSRGREGRKGAGRRAASASRRASR